MVVQSRARPLHKAHGLTAILGRLSRRSGILNISQTQARLHGLLRGWLDLSVVTVWEALDKGKPAGINCVKPPSGVVINTKYSLS
jgi:hypothetical protein